MNAAVRWRATRWQVTFVPGGKPRAGAGSMVASIELVRQ